METDALGRLTALLCARVGTEAMDTWHAEWAAKLLRQHAHELAEKIRNSEVLRSYTDDHMSDCYMAADVIDPEVAT